MTRGQPPQAIGVAIGKIDRDLQPLPTLGANGVGRRRQFPARKPIEQRHVLEPAALIRREEVAQDHAACRLIGLDPDEDRALVAGLDRSLGQHPPNHIGLLGEGAGERLPDRFLEHVVVRHAEGAELVERQLFRDIEIEQFLARRREFQALADDLRRDEETGGDLVDGHALVMQGLERPELVERVQGLTHRIFGERIFFLDPLSLDDAGNGRVLGKPFLLHQEFQRRESAAARAHREFAGLLAAFANDRPHAQRLQ